MFINQIYVYRYMENIFHLQKGETLPPEEDCKIWLKASEATCKLLTWCWWFCRLSLSRINVLVTNVVTPRGCLLHHNLSPEQKQLLSSVIGNKEDRKASHSLPRMIVPVWELSQTFLSCLTFRPSLLPEHTHTLTQARTHARTQTHARTHTHTDLCLVCMTHLVLLQVCSTQPVSLYENCSITEETTAPPAGKHHQHTSSTSWKSLTVDIYWHIRILF